MQGKLFYSLNTTVPLDNSQYKAISVSIHKCDICNSRILNAPDNIENYIQILKEIDDSFESERDKNEPTLLLCDYCRKEYLVPSFVSS